MPLCYGGGVTSAAQAAKIISLGVEKVSISAAAVENPNLVRELAEAVGKQSVVVVLDVIKRKGLFSKGYELTRNNTRRIKSILSRLHKKWLLWVRVKLSSIL